MKPNFTRTPFDAERGDLEELRVTSRELSYAVSFHGRIADVMEALEWVEEGDENGTACFKSAVFCLLAERAQKQRVSRRLVDFLGYLYETADEIERGEQVNGDKLRKAVEELPFMLI